MRIGPLSPYTLESEVAGLRFREDRSQEVPEVVSAVLDDVRRRGDAAVVAASQRLDWAGASAETLRVPVSDMENAFHELDPELIAALELMRDNLRWFHQKELRPDWEEQAPTGQTVGIRYLAAERAGLYVPGGLAPYPSSVIMNAVPAQVAGVRELVIATPPSRDGSVALPVLAAAHLLGIHEVYRVGGVQAIAALAFGTETVPRCDVVTGPGNAYVAEAKRQLYGVVGIDGVTGPSEVVVVVDEAPQAAWAAADLLAQAEHGSGAVAVLLAPSEEVARSIEAEVDQLLRDAKREPHNSGADGLDEPVAGWAEAGETVFAYYPEAGESFRDVASAFVNLFAPEHLELHVGDPRGYLDDFRAAGAVFLGAETPTAFGDYVAGTNHVLPTGGAARFSSPLSVDTFRRKSWLLEMDSASLERLAPAAELLAETEGFAFHARSAALRRRGER